MDVRPARDGDLEQLSELYNHYVLKTAITFDVTPIEMDARREWLESFADTGPHRLFVAVEGETLLGYACSRPHRPKAAYATTVEASIFVLDGRTGRGIGTGLYRALFDALATEDLHRAVAGITLPNPGSIALHERFGFRPVGVYTQVGLKFDRFWDVAWFEKHL